MRSLANKKALVTGGSRGIGAAIVQPRAKEGADVAFSYASSHAEAEAVRRLAESERVRAVALRADHTEMEEVVAMVSEKPMRRSAASTSSSTL